MDQWPHCKYCFRIEWIFCPLPLKGIFLLLIQIQTLVHKPMCLVFKTTKKAEKEIARAVTEEATTTNAKNGSLQQSPTSPAYVPI